MWQPGDAIALRERWGDAIFEARAATVVQDLPEQTMLFVPAHVVCAIRSTTTGSSCACPTGPGIWSSVRAATSASSRSRGPTRRTPSSCCSTPTGSPRGWYVNLQTPLARTPVGFDTVDHALDVLVTLDRSSWTWKDEDELAEAIALGLFTEADAASFRYWGERAVEHLVLRQPPFDDGLGGLAARSHVADAGASPGWDIV